VVLWASIFKWSNQAAINKSNPRFDANAHGEGVVYAEGCIWIRLSFYKLIIATQLTRQFSKYEACQGQTLHSL